MDIQEILIEAGAIGNADIRPDDSVTVTAGDRRLCFGPCWQDGDGNRFEEPRGWDVTEYYRDDQEGDEFGWREGGYTYAETDAAMTALAAKYAG